MENGKPSAYCIANMSRALERLVSLSILVFQKLVTCCLDYILELLFMDSWELLAFEIPG